MMEHKKLSDIQESEYDIALDTRKNNAQVLGDSAAALCRLYDLKQKNPDKKILYLQLRKYQDLDFKMFAWPYADVQYSNLIHPVHPKNIYSGCIWSQHDRINKEHDIIIPRLRRPADLPEEYVCLCPVWNKSYNTWRNLPLDWWRNFEAPIPIYECDQEPSVMRALAIISNATCVLTGDGGACHWACLFGVPLVYVGHVKSSYWFPRHKSSKILRPSFGQKMSVQRALDTCLEYAKSIKPDTSTTKTQTEYQIYNFPFGNGTVEVNVPWKWGYDSSQV